jgi:hypothetical protein
MDITKAIELSLKEQRSFNQGTYEPLNAEQRLKKPGMPVGLKNVGNSISIILSNNSLLCEFSLAILLYKLEVCLVYFGL